MGDSDTKKFGDKFLKQLTGQLNQPASVYGKSLFVGAGDGTKDAWRASRDYANEMLGSGGYSSGQQRGVNMFGDIANSYGRAGAESTSGLSGIGDAYGQFAGNGGLNDAQTRAQSGLGWVANGYRNLGDNNGLTGRQAGAMNDLRGLGGDYAALGKAYDPNSAAYKRLRQGVADDTLSNLGSQFTASGRFGGGSYIDTASQGLGDALAGLDYNNMQNNVDNQYRSLDSRRGVLGDVFGMGQQGVNNQFGSLAGRSNTLNSMFGNAQTGTNNQFNALAGQTGIENSIFGNRMAALAGRTGAADRIYGAGSDALTNRENALNRLSQFGAAQDANRQGMRLGQADLFDRQNNAQLARLAQISSIFGGGVGGSGATGAANEAPWWQQLLGYVGSNAGKALGFGG